MLLFISKSFQLTDPSSESDDNSDVVDVEEHYSRLTRDDRLNPPSSRRGYNFRESERNNRFGKLCSNFSFVGVE